MGSTEMVLLRVPRFRIRVGVDVVEVSLGLIFRSQSRTKLMWLEHKRTKSFSSPTLTFSLLNMSQQHCYLQPKCVSSPPSVCGVGMASAACTDGCIQYACHLPLRLCWMCCVLTGAAQRSKVAVVGRSKASRQEKEPDSTQTQNSLFFPPMLVVMSHQVWVR